MHLKSTLQDNGYPLTKHVIATSTEYKTAQSWSYFTTVSKVTVEYLPNAQVDYTV